LAIGAVEVGELLQQCEPRGAELLGHEYRGIPRDGPGGWRLRGRGGGRGSHHREGAGRRTLACSWRGRRPWIGRFEVAARIGS